MKVAKLSCQYSVACYQHMLLTFYTWKSSDVKAEAELKSM